MRFRKRPVVIEAEQFIGQDIDGVCRGAADEHGCVHCELMAGTPHIHTLEGVMVVSAGDWVITGVQGEKYPCKADIFAATYEPA